MKILCIVPLQAELLQKLREQFPHVEVVKCKKIEEADDAALQAEVLMAYISQLNDEVLNRLPKLRWIQVFSAGVDHLALDQLEARGITLTNASGAHKIPMSEYAIGVMLQEVKHYISLYEQQKQSVWNQRLPFGELDGKTVSILGAGSIGQEIAKRAKVFGMHTIGVNRSGREADGIDQMYMQKDVDHALRQADFVILAAPLTKETYHWVNAEKLSQMKHDAVLINLGRGELIDEGALIDCLQEHAIKRAYLDVFQVEPLPVESPLWKLDNCVITPHISAISERYNERCLEIFIHNLQQYMNNEALTNIVEPSIGY